MDNTALALRSTIGEICGHRDKALELFGIAHAKLLEADGAIRDAKTAATLAARSENSYSYHSRNEDAEFLNRMKIPDVSRYMDSARKMLDRSVWSFVIDFSQLEQVMDKKAREELRQSLMSDPPEATEDNIRATIETLMGQADMMFRRGVAECFSNLDRRFKSHDGWKIGSRIILDNAINDSGSWSYYRNHQDTIADIERVFHLLDDRQVPANYASLAWSVERERGRRWCRWTGMVETEFFRVRIFLNGNVHIWFKRDDLLAKVNKVLGEYYDAPIPEERGPDEDTGFNRPKTEIAKNFAFYPTPDEPAEELISKAKVYQWPIPEKDHRYYKPENMPQQQRILEPSAGTGNLARRLANLGHKVDCIEYQPALASQLIADGIYNSVKCCDFLAVKPPIDPELLYDRVVLNPPFDRERDIDHVIHAWKFLKPNGRLVAIMIAGTEFRETIKARAFRAFVEQNNGRFTDLPARSFASVGTYVNTIILEINRDGSRSYY